MILALIYAFVILRRGSVYIVGSTGYRAFKAESVIHHTDHAGLLKVVARLLKGDIVDMLWVSHFTDQYGGVMVCTVDGVPELSETFKTHSEQLELKAFKVAMNPLGYKLSEGSDGFNGGVGEEFRVTTLEYTLPSQAEEVAKAIETALEHLEGKSSEYHMTGSLFANGPGEGSGIKFRPREDPLAEIFGS